jgi:putative ABC transport system ATP-binding protein
MSVALSPSRAIDVRALTKTYGEGAVAFQALKGVDFFADEGEFVILSGPSGSGKTTLLSILGCVLAPTSGAVSLFGRDVSRATESELPFLRLELIGFIFQGFNLIASLDASENVELVLRLRGLSAVAAREEAKELLGRVGLADKLRSLPRDLSGGERQRVSIARALSGSPPLILADEPTASLDAQAGQTAMELLRELAREHKTTVVVVTHDNRIFHFADRRVHIEDGRLRSLTEREKEVSS